LQFGSSLQASLFFARAQDQIRAHLREGVRHLAAQADGTAGDDRDAAGEIEELFDVHGASWLIMHSIDNRAKALIRFETPPFDKTDSA